MKLALLALAASLGTASPQATAGRTLVVGPGGDFADLAPAVAAARDGDTIEVRGGAYRGPIVVERAVALVGVDRPVIDGGGQGTVVSFKAPGGRIAGFAVRGSGARADKEDAGIAAFGTVTIEDNVLDDVLYGIDLQIAPRSLVAGNRITGRDIDIARRGDALRLWESHDSRVVGNRIDGARDVVVWYSERVTLEGNTVSGGRYGLHFMYATGGRVVGNRFERNAAGAYAMYSSDLVYARNVLAGNHGLSGYGIALKDTDDVTLEGNVIAGNRAGIYFDNSPSKAGATNAITGNVVAYNDIGALFMPSVKGNTLGANSFIENAQQVAVVTGGDFGGNDWTPGGAGNYWSGYAGYDADGDGLGDLPHAEVSLFHNLLDRHPDLRLFVLSPAQSALDLAARAFPVFRPRPTLVDTAPRVRPSPPAIPPAAAGGGALATLAVALVATAVGTVMWGRGIDRTFEMGSPAP